MSKPMTTKIKRKWVAERLDSKAYNGCDTSWEQEAAKKAYDFIEEHEAAGNAIIETVVEMLEEACTEQDKRTRKARRAYAQLRKEMAVVLKKASATAGK